MLRRLLLLFLEPRIDHKKANVSQSIRLKTFYIDEVSLLNRLDYKTRSSPNKATAPDLWSCRVVAARLLVQKNAICIV